MFQLPPAISSYVDDSVAVCRHPRHCIATGDCGGNLVVCLRAPTTPQIKPTDVTRVYYKRTLITGSCRQTWRMRSSPLACADVHFNTRVPIPFKFIRKTYRVEDAFPLQSHIALIDSCVERFTDKPIHSTRRPPRRSVCMPINNATLRPAAVRDITRRVSR